MSDSVTWGKSAGRCVQGSARRGTLRWFWSAHWSGLWDTHERDGAMNFVGNELVSENRVFISMPCAVIDDFGNLVAVPFFYGEYFVSWRT